MIIDKKLYFDSLRWYCQTHNYKLTGELVKILLERLDKEAEDRFPIREVDLWPETYKIVEQYQNPKGRLELLWKVDELEEQLHFIRQEIESQLQPVTSWPPDEWSETPF